MNGWSGRALTINVGFVATPRTSLATAALAPPSRYSAAMTRRPSQLPEDVEPDQLWRAPDGQHYKVISVSNGRVAMHRATPAGRVLNTRYQAHESLEKMQAEWQLVSK
jgi:hypothetical protein